MKKKILCALGISCLGAMAIAVFVRPSMGTNPDEARREIYKSSKNFSFEKEIFINRKPRIIDDLRKRSLNLHTLLEFLEEKPRLKPTEPLPEIKPDLKFFLESSEKLKAIWLGHSSFILNLEGKIILVDPVFSDSASPVSFIVPRFQKPVLELGELPEIDYILISHDHFDHLDMKVAKFFKDSQTIFITPLGVGSHLENWGVSLDKIIEKDWWEEIEFDQLKFIATPAQHFSGRGPFDASKTLWASWVIQGKFNNVYFSGDSGYDTHFKLIGEKYGPFDIAFIETGQYNKKWEEVHLLPDQSVMAYKDLGAKKYFPVHWGMFVLAFHPWDEPVKEIYKRRLDNNIELIIPKIGQIYELDSPYNLETWWVR